MQNFNKKKAFTLIELLIVIAIIGILFIVLVSKVDFATDKAKASGVQTDFRSFQVAMEMVAKENAGFNTFGWDTGDNGAGVANGVTISIGGKNYTYTNAEKDAGDRVRNAYDEGDLNLNGIYDKAGENGLTVDEVWTGRKIYTETWTGIYTLDNPANANDKSAIFDLETAINKNLDPKLHIVIADDGFITMANGAMDPWKTQYTGQYLSNATAETAAIYNNDGSMSGVAGDALDRGAIVMYSYGANQKLGCKEKVVGGIVTVTVSQVNANTPDNNTKGADDYSLAVIYTYKNGYGEIISTTTGFSNNQTTNGGDTISLNGTHTMLDGTGSVVTLSNIPSFRSDADANDLKEVKVDGNVVDASNYTVTSGSTIITFKEAFIRTLENGNHTIEIVSSTGTASCSFEVNLGSYFTVGSSKFYFEDNMSWDDFLCSQYNVDNRFYNTYTDGGVIGADNLYLWPNATGSGRPVNMYETIQPNATYYLLDYRD